MKSQIHDNNDIDIMTLFSTFALLRRNANNV